MRGCLERFHRLSNLVNKFGGTPGEEPGRINVRVVLAAYMIVVRPTNVFEDPNVPEVKNVCEAAKNLLLIFEEILLLTGPFHTISKDLSKSLPQAVSRYLSDFKAWKVPDEAKLVARIQVALIALYQGLAQLPQDEESTLKTEFETQIRTLRDKLRQISSPATLARFDEDNRILISSVGGGDGGGATVVARRTVGPMDRMTNERLAHELLMDPLFQLLEDGHTFESESSKRIRHLFENSFWESLAGDLNMSPPCYVRVLRVLEEIRKGLLDVAPAREAAFAAEILDMDLIKQQADGGFWTWVDCRMLLEGVVSLIKGSQSTERAEETRTKWVQLQISMDDAVAEEKSAVLVEGIRFLLNRISVMRMDAANKQLRVLSPVMRVHGVEYERGKLKEKLNDGTLTLERTKAWLLPVCGITRQIVAHSTAVIGLITGENELREAECPETLLMDMARINLHREELDHIVKTSTLAMLILGKVGQDKVARIVAALTSDRDIGLAVEKVMGGERMDVAVEQCSSKDNVVNALMRKRVVAALGSEQVTGFHNSVVPLVQGLVGKVKRLININREVHGDTYVRIFAELFASAGGGSVGEAAAGGGEAAAGGGEAAAGGGGGGSEAAAGGGGGV